MAEASIRKNKKSIWWLKDLFISEPDKPNQHVRFADKQYLNCLDYYYCFIKLILTGWRSSKSYDTMQSDQNFGKSWNNVSLAWHWCCCNLTVLCTIFYKLHIFDKGDICIQSKYSVKVRKQVLWDNHHFINITVSWCSIHSICWNITYIGILSPPLSGHRKWHLTPSWKL